MVYLYSGARKLILRFDFYFTYSIYNYPVKTERTIETYTSDFSLPDVYMAHLVCCDIVHEFTISSTGKEKDEETGYGYFGARYYDADLLTGWLSVDPMADKYPSMSPYNYCAGNPMKLVDPDGCEFGDYYNESGKYLGSDGIEDGKIYVVPFKTDQRKVENGNYNVEKYELPSLESRNLMCEYLEHSDQNDNLREYGGSIWEDELTGEQELRYAIPGTRWNGESHSASVIVNDNGNDGFDASGKRVLTFFHSHFSGTINGHGLRQYPSGIDDDINNGDVQNVMKNGSRFGDARLPYNIMVAMKTKEVFLYTSVGVKCKMNLDVFKGIGGTK